MCKWSVYLDKGIWVSMWRLFKYDKIIRGENERMCSIYNRTICYTYTCNKTTHILLTSCTCNINIKSHLYWIYTHNEYTSNRYIISLCMQSSIQKVWKKSSFSLPILIRGWRVYQHQPKYCKTV